MKEWSKQQILEKILTDDKWLFRGILAIYNLQTESEKLERDTNTSNGVGFSGVHAKTMSYYAEYIKRRGELTGDYKIKARRIMVKYTGQLTKIANKEIVI